jgi:MFS family permease
VVSVRPHPDFCISPQGIEHNDIAFSLGCLLSFLLVVLDSRDEADIIGLDVCAQLSTLNFGIFLVYWIDYAFSSHTASYAWRIPVILQCVCIIPMFFILLVIPETPRWLAAHDQPEECYAVLKRIKGVDDDDDQDIQRLHSVILETVAYEASIGAGSWKDVLKEDSIKSRRRLLIACGIQAFQQLGGINAIICELDVSVLYN